MSYSDAFRGSYIAAVRANIEIMVEAEAMSQVDAALLSIILHRANITGWACISANEVFEGMPKECGLNLGDVIDRVNDLVEAGYLMRAEVDFVAPRHAKIHKLAYRICDDIANLVNEISVAPMGEY